MNTPDTPPLNRLLPLTLLLLGAVPLHAQSLVNDTFNADTLGTTPSAWSISHERLVGTNSGNASLAVRSDSGDNALKFATTANFKSAKRAFAPQTIAVGDAITITLDYRCAATWNNTNGLWIGLADSSQTIARDTTQPNSGGNQTHPAFYANASPAGSTGNSYLRRNQASGSTATNLGSGYTTTDSGTTRRTATITFVRTATNQLDIISDFGRIGQSQVTASTTTSWFTYDTLFLVKAAGSSGNNVFIDNVKVDYDVDVTSTSPEPVGVPGNWTLTLNEQFGGTSLTPGLWRLGAHHTGTAGLNQAGNSSKNVAVGSGYLRLTGSHAPISYGGDDYDFRAAEISTFDNVTNNGPKKGFTQLYGYFEARMRWDTTTGMWPAFWLMPDRGLYGNANHYERTYLRFDTGAGSPTNVTSAKLRVRLKSYGNPTPGSDIPNVVAMGVTDDTWTESAITWANMPAADGLWHDQMYYDTATGTPAVGSVVEFDVTDLVAAQAASGDKTYSICLADTYMKTNRTAFHSREASNSNHRPVLVINGTTYQASADATVVNGGNVAVNFGTTDELGVRDGYGPTARIDQSNGGRGMEIDIMESLGIWGGQRVSHALHWGNYNGAKISYDSVSVLQTTSDETKHNAKGWHNIPTGSATTGWHVYGVYWNAGILEFYVDGVKTGEVTGPRIMNIPAYILLSLQLGGWDNNHPTSTIDGKTCDIDYVRVWSGSK